MIYPTPGQLVRNAWFKAHYGQQPPKNSWAILTDAARKEWEDIAQAGIKASPELAVTAIQLPDGVIVLAFNRALTEAQREEIRRTWEAEGASIVIAEDVAAVKAWQPDEVREQLEALQKLADEDTQVLDEGLSGGAQEELHVRVNLARQALGLDVCGCTECQVSLGLEPDDDE